MKREVKFKHIITAAGRGPAHLILISKRSGVRNSIAGFFTPATRNHFEKMNPSLSPTYVEKIDWTRRPETRRPISTDHSAPRLSLKHYRQIGWIALAILTGLVRSNITAVFRPHTSLLLFISPHNWPFRRTLTYFVVRQNLSYFEHHTFVFVWDALQYHN